MSPIPARHIVLAANLETFLESNGGVQVAVGLGAYLGLLNSNPSANATEIANAQGLLNALLPTAVAQALVGMNMGQSGSMSDDDVMNQLTSAASTEVQAIVNADLSGQQLGQLQSQILSEDDGVTSLSQGVLQTLTGYSFTEGGVTVGAGTTATYNTADGLQVQFLAAAGAGGSVTTSGASVTIQAAAAAEASATLIINPHVQIVEFAQAIADGSIVANPLGVSVTGQASAAAAVGVMLYGNTQVNAIIEAAAQGSAVVTVLGVAASGQAGVGAGVEATNAQMGNVGLGAVQGQEVSTISVGAYESAATGIAFGKETEFKVNTFEGVKISAGTQGSLSYDGVSVGGGRRSMRQARWAAKRTRRQTSQTAT